MTAKPAPSAIPAPTPEDYARVAAAVRSHDFMLLATGAGFSADSGLPVYNDIANVPAYNAMGVSYMDLCNPEWVEKDKEIFYGFWGACLEDYRRITPHEGYRLIQGWRDEFYGTRHTVTRQDLIEDGVPAELRRFYIQTSNVDTHSVKAGYEADEVFEFHGNTERWSCHARCRPDLFALPRDYAIQVDRTTMRAAEREIDAAREPAFRGNHPRCPACNGPARPGILMFQDPLWTVDPVEETRFNNWEKGVLGTLRANPEKKLLIVEIGCGLRVPTIRRHSEYLLRRLGAQCTLVRINPDFPEIKEGEAAINAISINARALEAIRAVHGLLHPPA